MIRNLCIVNTESGGEFEQVILESASLISMNDANDAAVPSRILIVPLGEVHSTAGNFVADEEALAATIAAFQQHRTDLPIDYEHQTLGGAYSSPNGQAPAAGWIKSLTLMTASDGNHPNEPSQPGLWAEVSWTIDARQKLAHRHYRYLSPVVLVRRSDRRIVGLHSVALTNKPAIVGMQPLVNYEAVHEVLAAAATEQPAIPEFAESLAALRKILSLESDANEALILHEAIGRIREHEALSRLREATDRVTLALAGGKIAPAQRTWALAFAQRSPQEFDEWAASAPVLVAPGRMSNSKKTPHADRRRAVEMTARAEWQANRGFLEKLCTQEAYVATVLRDCGM